MDRLVTSSQMQTNSSQSKALIQSLTDPSVSGRQQNRNNNNRRKNERNDSNNNKNVFKNQPNCSQRHSHSKGGRLRSSATANSFNCDLLDHMNQKSSEQLSDKSENKKIFGPKKHNLNHLLNFTFDSREQTTNEHRIDRRGAHRYNRGAVRYNKEHFLQANCQFVVNDLNDYSIHSSDPDICVDWNSIEEIRFNSLTAETYCPICLDTPVAPKMTRCGHIYCWSCVLHYLSLSDHKWRKCPICFDSIQSDDLKTVSSINKIDYKIGDFITLSLMKRKKGSTIASPVLLYDNNKNCLNQKFEPLNGDPVISSYQKLLIASPNQVLSQIIEREKSQLKAQMVVDKETPEVCFIETALDQLKNREELLLERCQLREDNEKEKEYNMNNESSDANDFYYFYQSEDGQHIYLHSLNVRILKQEFGNLENCPNKICSKIIDTEWETMSEESRKRHRYLQHLPLTCEFRVVELEFDTQLISNKTLELFIPEVIRRQKTRSKRAREEKRRERHIQVEQNKRIHGIYPRPKYQLDNWQQFPACNDTIDGQRSPSPTFSSESSTTDMPLNQLKENPIDYGCSPHEPEFPSFAAMLREGRVKQEIPKTIKGNTLKEPLNEETDEEYQRPLHNYSLCEALEAALELKSTAKPQDLCETKKSGSKKKKNKPILLMSTAMKRSY